MVVGAAAVAAADDPALGDDGRRAADRAVPVAPVPVDQRRGVGGQPGVGVGEGGRRGAQADRAGTRPGVRRALAEGGDRACGGPALVGGGDGDGAGPCAVDVDRKDRPGAVEAQQQRFAGLERCQRQQREAGLAGHVDPRVAGQHRARVRAGGLRRDPLRVGPPLGRAVEPPAGEHDGHLLHHAPHDPSAARR